MRPMILLMASFTVASANIIMVQIWREDIGCGKRPEDYPPLEVWIDIPPDLVTIHPLTPSCLSPTFPTGPNFSSAKYSVIPGPGPTVRVDRASVRSSRITQDDKCAIFVEWMTRDECKSGEWPLALTGIHIEVRDQNEQANCTGVSIRSRTGLERRRVWGLDFNDMEF